MSKKPCKCMDKTKYLPLVEIESCSVFRNDYKSETSFIIEFLHGSKESYLIEGHELKNLNDIIHYMKVLFSGKQGSD